MNSKNTSYLIKEILDNIPMGIVVVDTGKKIIQINKTTAHILKYESFQDARDNLISKNFYEIFSNNDSECGPEKEDTIIRDAKVRINHNGHGITLLKNVFPSVINEKKVSVNVILDISDFMEHEIQLENETKRANFLAKKSRETEERLKKYNENLELKVRERTEELEHVISNLKEAQSQLVQSEKLVSIGQLAAGIAHEVNTPIQYVGDNIRFFDEAFTDLLIIAEKFEKLPEELSEKSSDTLSKEIYDIINRCDLEYLKKEVPGAIDQSMEGVDRVAKIVCSMKEFSYPAISKKTEIDINKALESTITVSRNEWKYCAEIRTDLDRSMPLVPCHPGELNQVFLNIIINAAHAIEEKKDSRKGLIIIKTRKYEDFAEIRISDSGNGIPEEIQSKIFDPFFTTKEVGRGSGQGLSISYPVIVEKHSGELFFESREGSGTTFIVRLPLNG